MGWESLCQDSGCAKVLRFAIGFQCYQSAKEIPRSIVPWLPHVDYVIVEDGRYWTPQTPAMKKMNLPKYSTDNTQDIIRKVCGDKLIYEKRYAPQMDKRQRCLDIAGELGCDYMITWDSDDFIHLKYQDFTKFKKELETAARITNDWIFYMWAWIPDDKLYPKQHNAVDSNAWRMYGRIHKNPGEQRYAQSHWTFSKKEYTDEIINKWKFEHSGQVGLDYNRNNPYFLQANVLIDGVRINTDRTYRDYKMLKFGDGWAFQNIHYEAYQYEFLPAVKHSGLKIALEDYEYFFNEQGQRWTYNKDGTVMTKEQVRELVAKEEKALVAK